MFQQELGSHNNTADIKGGVMPPFFIRKNCRHMARRGIDTLVSAHRLRQQVPSAGRARAGALDGIGSWYRCSGCGSRFRQLVELGRGPSMVPVLRLRQQAPSAGRARAGALDGIGPWYRCSGCGSRFRQLVELGRGPSMVSGLGTGAPAAAAGSASW